MLLPCSDFSACETGLRGCDGKRIILEIRNPVSASSLPEPELLFEPFYRLSPSRNDTGSGLGISTVHSIINAHGLHITDFLEENTQCENHSKAAEYKRTQNQADSLENARAAGKDRT